MSQGKRKRGDEATVPDALVDTLKSFLQYLPSEQKNDFATALEHLEAGPKQRVSARTLEDRHVPNYYLDSSSY
jgi:hypothetical protein